MVAVWLVGVIISQLYNSKGHCFMQIQFKMMSFGDKFGYMERMFQSSESEKQQWSDW